MEIKEFILTIFVGTFAVKDTGREAIGLVGLLRKE
jgi:hypothetical protein